MPQRLSPALALAALAMFPGASGCSNVAALDLNAGPVTFSVDTGQLVVPAALRAGAAVPRVTCATDETCAPLSGGGFQVRCSAGLCDPDPVTLDLSVGGVIDLNAYATQLGAFGDQLTQIQLRRVTFRATAAGLTVAVGPTELYWGPETATHRTSEGVRLLGRLPVLSLSGGAMATGELQLDGPGSVALSNHLLRTSRRFRLLARPTVDLTPGGLLPAGQAVVSIQLLIHVEGEVLRCDDALRSAGVCS